MIHCLQQDSEAPLQFPGAACPQTFAPKMPRLLLVLFALAGLISCKPKIGAPYAAETVEDAGGRARLHLYQVPVGKDGADFHSLVWESFDGAEWSELGGISRASFESGTKVERWVSELGSIDPETWSAIIKVAEGDAPLGSPRINYVYSWRRWDLTKNTELEHFYDLADGELFDPFEPRRISEQGD